MTENDQIENFKKAIEADPWCFDAWVGLARAQNRSGEHEKAKVNCETGLEELGKSIATEMKNDEQNPVLKMSRPLVENDIWIQCAGTGALYLSARDDTTDHIAWPTPEAAENEERTGEHKGLYWTETSLEGKQAKYFLPNFFNTFYDNLRGNKHYSSLVRELGLALERLGQHEEAQQHLSEAQLFEESN